MNKKYNLIMLLASFIIVLNLLYPPRISDSKVQERAFIFGDVHKCNKQMDNNKTSWQACTIKSHILWAQNGIILVGAISLISASKVIDSIRQMLLGLERVFCYTSG